MDETPPPPSSKTPAVREWLLIIGGGGYKTEGGGGVHVKFYPHKKGGGDGKCFNHAGAGAHMTSFGVVFTRWLEVLATFNPIDPNPAISAHAVFPQSGHIRPEKRTFFHIFPHFSKLEPNKK